ncbi:hypothetical protein CXU06_11505 [Akkermansia muciniphila]|jgi:hypothetical protein|nr:hypothetical protein CXU06_11505 [Akkermansia muciniphila]
MNQTSIIKQMFQALSEKNKADILNYLHGEPVKSTELFPISKNSLSRISPWYFLNVPAVLITAQLK